MTKTDLVAAVAAKTKMTKAAAGEAVDATIEAITEALKAGGDVRLTGFGTFAVSKRAAREGRNPRTGKPVAIKASKSARFTAGKALKDALN